MEVIRAIEKDREPSGPVGVFLTDMFGLHTKVGR